MRRSPLFMTNGIRLQAMPRAANLTVYPVSGVTATVTDQTYGVSIASNGAALFLLNTGYANARVDLKYYLTGFDGLDTHQFGIALRASSDGNFDGYLPAIRYTPTSEGGLNYGQLRRFGGTGGASSVLGTDVTPPGNVQTYETGLVNIAAEIVGSSYQWKAWLNTEAEPDWQASGTDTLFPTGQFGVGMNRGYSNVTTHITWLFAREITALS